MKRIAMYPLVALPILSVTNLLSIWLMDLIGYAKYLVAATGSIIDGSTRCGSIAGIDMARHTGHIVIVLSRVWASSLTGLQSHRMAESLVAGKGPQGDDTCYMSRRVGVVGTAMIH